MMCGYTDSHRPLSVAPRRYQVVESREGWRVTVNGCMTRPLALRADAEGLALRLQREADQLTHRHAADICG